MSRRKPKADDLFEKLQDDGYRNFIIEDKEKMAEPSLQSAEKDRIYNAVIDNIIQIKSDSKIKTPRRPSFFYTKTVPLLVICLILLGTTAATATANLKLSSKLADFLGVDASEQQNVDVMSVNTEAVKANDNLTMTDAQAVGDGKNIYVTFDVTVPRDVALDEDCMFNDTDIMIDGQTGSWGCTYQFLDCHDNKATVMMNIAFDENAAGKKIIIKNSDIGKYVDTENAEKMESDSQAGFKTLVAGSWTVSCKIANKNSGQEHSYRVEQPIVVNGQTYQWQKLDISPFSATLYFDCPDNTDMDGIFDGFAINMKDGSVLNEDDCSMIMGDSNQIDISFGKMIDLKKIESVTVAGTVYKLDEHYKPNKTQRPKASTGNTDEVTTESTAATTQNNAAAASSLSNDQDSNDQLL